MRTFNALIDALGGPWCLLLTLIILTVIPSVLGYIILRPISKVAGRMRAPNRFMLSDFFWLVIQLQLALGYCVQFVGIEHVDFFILICGFLTWATVCMWAGAVSIMSRAGVVIPSRRAAFILFLLPVTLAVMMGASFSVLLGVILQFEFVSEDFQRGLEIMAAKSHLGLREILIGFALLPALCYGLRQMGFWILNGSDPQSLEVAKATEIPSQGVA